VSRAASPLDPPEAVAGAPAVDRPLEPKASWKPASVTAVIWLIPALAIAFFLAVVVHDVAEVVGQPTPRGARVEAPLRELWTGAERQRLETHPFFREGVLAEDLRPWAFTPPAGMASVRGAEARAAYDRALQRLRDGAGGGDPQALAEARRLLTEADGALRGAAERGPILYHQALAAYWAGDYGEARRLIEGDGGSGRGALALIEGARRSGQEPVAARRLDGEEITVRYLLGHVYLKAGDPGRAAKEFDKALKVAGGANYRGQYSGIVSLDPRQHLTDLSTGSLWTDLIAAKARAGALTRALLPDRAHEELYDRPGAVSTHRQLAASVALLAARDGRDDVVGRIAPPPGDDPASADAYAIAMRAMGLGAPDAPVSNALLDDARDWDRITCLRRERAPWLAGVGQGACGARDLGGFERRWQREFGERYARALAKAGPEGQRLVAADRRFSFPARWDAAQRVAGRPPWLSLAALVLLGLAALAATLGAVVVNARYDAQFRPMHFEDRRRQGHLRFTAKGD